MRIWGSGLEVYGLVCEARGPETGLTRGRDGGGGGSSSSGGLALTRSSISSSGGCSNRRRNRRNGSDRVAGCSWHAWRDGWSSCGGCRGGGGYGGQLALHACVTGRVSAASDVVCLVWACFMSRRVDDLSGRSSTARSRATHTRLIRVITRLIRVNTPLIRVDDLSGRSSTTRSRARARAD